MKRIHPLWGYRFAPVAIIVIRQELFVFNGSHLPAMWRARSVEVSAATNDAPLPSFVFVSSLLTMSYSVSSSSSAGGMPRVTAAAWKIRHGERRGFEDGLWDAQAQNRDGRWVVIARRASKRRSIPGEGMDPLF